MTEGRSFEVQWFVPEAPAGSTLSIFYEPANAATGDPGGNRVDLLTDLLPQKGGAVVPTTGMTALAQDMFIGLRFTRPGQPEIVAYAPGKIRVMSATQRLIRVTAPWENLAVQLDPPPTDPEADPQTLPVDIEFQATDPTGHSTVTVFYDKDGVANGNEVVLASGLPLNTELYTLEAANLAPGMYYLGVSVGTTPENQVYAYASGRLLVMAADDEYDPETLGALRVLSPAESIPVSKGNNFGVRWFINDDDGGTIQVFAEPDVDGDDLPDGDAARVFAKNPITHDVYELNAADSIHWFDSGVLDAYKTYFVGAIFTSSTGSKTTAYAPGKVYVAAGQLWVGDVTQAFLRGGGLRGRQLDRLRGQQPDPPGQRQRRRGRRHRAGCL